MCGFDCGAAQSITHQGYNSQYRAKNVFIPLAIPGPSSLGSLESFIYPLFQEMARASEGIPDKEHQSQYKIYEWMALLHWYIIPIA
jgi:hypothetical protein